MGVTDESVVNFVVVKIVRLEPSPPGDHVEVEFSFAGVDVV